MASLSDVNQTLMDQNDSLKDIAQNSVETKNLILKQLQNTTGFKAIERQQESSINRTITGASGVATGAMKGVGNALGNLTGLFQKGGMVGLLALLAKGLITRGVPALLMTSFSDNIAEYLAGEDGSDEVKGVIERSIIGGSLGFLLGWRGALVGSLLGALLTDENRAKLSELGENFASLASEWNLTLPSFESTLNFITNTFGGALDFINNIISGDFSEAFTKNLDDLVLAVGGLFLLFSPKGTISLALKGLKKTMGLAKTAFLAGATGLGAKEVVKNTTKAATTATAATAAAGSVVLSKSGNKMIAGADGKATTVKAPAGSKVGDIPALTGPKVEKYAKLMKFLKFPGIGLVMSVPEIISIVTSDKSKSEKAKGLSGIVGGTLASGGGAVLGGAIGAFGGPAAPLTAPLGMLAGGIGGYFLGDYLTKKIVGLMLGEPDNSKLETGESSQPQPQKRAIGSIRSIERGSSYKVNGKEATPEQRQAKLDYRPGTVSESISTEALQENANAKNQPAVIMQNNSAPQVNNVSSSSTPIIAPMVNNADVNDSLVVAY